MSEALRQCTRCKVFKPLVSFQRRGETFKRCDGCRSSSGYILPAETFGDPQYLRMTFNQIGEMFNGRT